MAAIAHILTLARVAELLGEGETLRYLIELHKADAQHAPETRETEREPGL